MTRDLKEIALSLEKFLHLIDFSINIGDMLMEKKDVF